MYARRLAVPIVTDGAGNATVYSDGVDSGLLSQVRYVKDGANPFSNGVSFTVTVEATGEAVWSEANVNASATRAPRQATHGVDGAAALYAAAGTPVQDKIAIAQDRFKIVVAGGGAAKNGVLHFLLV